MVCSVGDGKLLRVVQESEGALRCSGKTLWDLCRVAWRRDRAHKAGETSEAIAILSKGDSKATLRGTMGREKMNRRDVCHTSSLASPAEQPGRMER